MHKAKRLILALALVGALLVALAPIASAAPKVSGPRIPDCSAWVTVATGGVVNSGNVSLQAILQRATPGYCTEFRAKIVANTGVSEVHGGVLRNGAYTELGSVLTCCPTTLYTSGHSYSMPATYQAYGYLQWEGTIYLTATSPAVYLT